MAIAGVVALRPDIIILDEATSALDSTTEQKIIQNLRTIELNTTHKLEKKFTVIMIAHRLSTIKHADNIIVLKNKRIVESGTHKVLLQNRGEYYELWKNQEI